MSLPDENADLGALVHQLPEGLVIVRDGGVIYVNPTFARFVGRTEAEVRDHAFLDLLSEPYRALMVDWLETGTKDAPGDPGEYAFIRPDGSRVMLELRPMWVDNFAGRHACAFLARDISAVKRTQADLLLADRMMTVGALASGVAHEINNPMSFVIGNIHYSLSVLKHPEFPVGADLKEVLAAMQEALEGAERISRIVKNIHTFSKADHTSTSLLSLRSVVESALTASFVEIRRKARLIRDLRPTPAVLGNEARIRQVVLNLILNSVQALPDNQSTRHTIEISTFEDAGDAVFRIRDTGPGIAPQVLSHVFEPFFTTKPIGQGTGLGLSIAHSIVDQLGGTIEVDSALGEGTTFTVRLPPGSDSGEDEEASGVARILVVDDEPLIVRAFTQVLRDFELVVAMSGKEAIETLARDINFTLVFCDLYMPEVNGMDVHHWVRENRPGLERQIVFMTGGAHDAVSQKFLASVPNDRLTKPFRPEDIYAMIKRRTGLPTPDELS